MGSHNERSFTQAGGDSSAKIIVLVPHRIDEDCAKRGPQHLVGTVECSNLGKEGSHGSLQEIRDTV